MEVSWARVKGIRFNCPDSSDHERSQQRFLVFVVASDDLRGEKETADRFFDRPTRPREKGSTFFSTNWVVTQWGRVVATR